MQTFQVLHLLIFISLSTTIIEAQYYGSKPGCPRYCGNVRIYHPFGIGRNCSVNKWFSVDCRSSTPYLSLLNNVEMLSVGESSVMVNMSVIRADCENPVQDISLVRSTSHGKSPFLFSSSYNSLVVEGCGSAAIMAKNGTIVAGCSTTCMNDTVSDINNCFGVGCCQTTFPYDLESFTFNLTGLGRKELYGKENCVSAFLIAEYYSKKISLQSFKEGHTFVLISLSWNRNSIGCSDRCGEVMIPYAFGIGEFCSPNKWFNVECNSSTPYLSAFNNVQLLGVNLERETVTVKVSKISDCNNSVQTNYTDLFVSGSPFYLSDHDNYMFVVEGCGNAAIMDEDGTIVTGCSTTCYNDTLRDNANNCFGIGCCQTTIPYMSHRPFTFNLTGLQGRDGNVSCGSAFVMDTNSMEGRFSGQFVPMTLSWTMGAYDDPSTECRRCENQGGSCYKDNLGTSCHFYGSRKKSIILGVSISMGVLLLTVITYALCKIIKKTKIKRKKQRCFKRNGGLLLKQQEATHTGLVDKNHTFYIQ